MSYYGAKGDFYSGRTGYYRGDPGFFSSIGKFIKPIAGMAADYFTGGAASTVLGMVSGSPRPQPTISAAGSAGVGSMGTVAGTRSRRGRLSAAAGTMPGMARAAAPAVAAAMGGPLVSRGTAMNRVSAGGGFRRRGHRMNVCNPRALRRAIRRAKGFEKLALRSIRLVSPQKLHGKRRGGFKKTSRRR